MWGEIELNIENPENIEKFKFLVFVDLIRGKNDSFHLAWEKISKSF